MPDAPFAFDSIEDALQALEAGGCIVLVDDEDRENEGDLVALADRITPETINFMALEVEASFALP